MAKGFPWRFGFYFVLATYLVADMVVYRGPLHQRLAGGQSLWGGTGRAAVAATVYGQPITRLMLEQAMRDHLWRRGEAWEKLSPTAQEQTRTLVLEQMINARLIHANRTMNGLKVTPSAAVTREELQRFIQQFELGVGEYSRRRGLHHLTEAQLYEQMREANEDAAWVEEKIAARVDEVDEKAAREWLAEHGEASQMPERWRAAHLFLSSHNPIKDAAGKVIGEADREAEIRLLHGQLTTGQFTFEALTAKVSEDDRTKLAGGDLGWFSAARMPTDFIAALRALKLGALSAPVKTKLGWHIIRVVEHKAAEANTNAVNEVLAMLKNQRREAAVLALIAELRNEAVKGAIFVRRYAAVIEQTVGATPVR